MIISPGIFFNALIVFFFFFLKRGSTHEGTAHCPGEFCWQNQTVVNYCNAELLAAKKIGKYDHPVCRQPSNGDDRAVGS